MQNISAQQKKAKLWNMEFVENKTDITHDVLKMQYISFLPIYITNF
jgi:hypothetical protein